MACRKMERGEIWKGGQVWSKREVKELNGERCDREKNEQDRSEREIIMRDK